MCVRVSVTRYKSRKTRGDRARVFGQVASHDERRASSPAREMRRYKFSQRPTSGIVPVKNSRTTNGIVNSLREREREGGRTRQREHAFIKIVPFDPSDHPQGTILPLPLLRFLPFILSLSPLFTVSSFPSRIHSLFLFFL